jgi:DNA repair protein RadD
VADLVDKPFGPSSSGLRPYQLRNTDELRAAMVRGIKRILYVAETGSGKTWVFSHAAARAAERGTRVLIIAHRRELVLQAKAKLRVLEVDAGLILAGAPENATAAVQIALINSLTQRVKRGQYLRAFDLVIIDEAHHVAANTWLAVVNAVVSERGYCLGCTATPLRLDGKPLDFFETMVMGPSYEELYGGGYLCKATTFAPRLGPDLSGVKVRSGDWVASELARIMQEPQIIGDAVEHYHRLANNTSAICYCCTREHSRATVEAFRVAGTATAHVDGESTDEEREDALRGLADGSLQVVYNVQLFTEGIDVPSLGAVIVLRPTRSLALHKQICGRALRPSPGKTRGIILDHSGNTYRLGLYDAEHRWSLAGKQQDKSIEVGDAPLRRCSCGAVVPLSRRVCPYCGNVFFVVGGVREHRDGELAEINPDLLERLRLMPRREAWNWAGDDEDRLIAVALARNYRLAWVYRRRFELRNGGGQ